MVVIPKLVYNITVCCHVIGVLPSIVVMFGTSRRSSLVGSSQFSRLVTETTSPFFTIKRQRS